MFFQDRKKQREFLVNSWQKYTSNKPLDPLEEQLVSVIKIHPEYHDLIGNIESEYFPDQGEVNPFLHINLHLALRDQLSINQPKGIKRSTSKTYRPVQRCSYCRAFDDGMYFRNDIYISEK